MRKIFTKIICFTTAAVAALGVCLTSACSYEPEPLTGKNIFTKEEAVSNGGFAVEKGDYIYFINGKQNFDADNTYGEVVRGALMRINKSDLAQRNYSSVDTVVPSIIYSGNSNAGIFIYGDYVYYSTPSTEKNSDGEVQNTNLQFKSTKLDGTDTCEYYLQYEDNTVDYRYVKGDDGKVYLVYVATNETLYDEDQGKTNIHSINTQTREDTVLAYNVDSVLFDSNDVTNPAIYYTMKVTDFVLGSTDSSYNQIYTVTADAKCKYATGAVDYTKYLEDAFADEEDGYDPEKDPKYVNCGTLVLDGIGLVTTDKIGVTPFNGEGADKVSRSPYTYTLSSYQNGTLFYTRHSSYDSTESLFALKETTVSGEGWQPVSSNDDQKFIIRNGSAASTYTYIFDENGDIDYLLIAGSRGIIRTEIKDGVIAYNSDDDLDNVDTYYIAPNIGQPTVLFLDNNYIYYSLSGGNGYTINRVRYDGDYDKYNHPAFEDDDSDYSPVRILDLDSASDWYKPELFYGQILFPTQTANMENFAYIMACDLRVLGDNGYPDSENFEIMDNAGIKALNEKYEGIEEIINEIDESIYKNLKSALRYVYYTSDKDYIYELIDIFANLDETKVKKQYDEEGNEIEIDIVKYTLSKDSFEKIDDFLNIKNNWEDYADTVKVNGEDVAANRGDYYYAVLGKMSEEDQEALTDYLRSAYLQAVPEMEEEWFESLSDGEKAGFIIGVVAGGIIVIAGGLIVTRIIIRKRRQKLPTYKKKRIKVDTTDDKNIDVYSDEQ